MPGPKPTRTEDLTSWRAHLPSRKAEIQAPPLPVAPEVPEHLSADARVHWELVVSALVERRLLTALDLPAVCLLCERLADVRELKVEIGALHLVVTDQSIRSNPLYRVRERAIEDCRRLFDSFGMTPTARIGLPDPEKPKAGQVVNAHFPKG